MKLFIYVIFATNILLYNCKINYAGNFVTEQRAKLVANNFIEYKANLKGYSKNLAIGNIFTKYYQNSISYYIISYEDGGYVVVSANDATSPILSYSTTGRYAESLEEVPEYAGWMESYSEQIYDVILNNTLNSDNINKWYDIENKSFNYNKASNIVEPLLSSFWGQSYANDGAKCDSYNYYVTETSDACNNCESKKCTAGCVAVAMAQVIYYWKHPSMQYNIYTKYDWCNMVDELNFNDNPNYDVQRNAIAKLIRDCGTRVGMNYCSGWPIQTCSSSATTSNIPTVLINQFGFSSADFQRKMWYSDNVWLNRMKNNLNNGWPIIYSGYNSSTFSGHTFVCDGYDSDDFFHFNWGWGGQYQDEISDCWFKIDYIAPPGHEYSWEQDAIFYIYPNELHVDYCNNSVDLGIYFSQLLDEYPSVNPWAYVPVYSTTLYSANSDYPESYRTIPSGESSVYKAYNKIILQPGFKASYGSSFVAKIINCPSCNTSKNLILKKDILSANIDKSLVNQTNETFFKNSKIVSPKPDTIKFNNYDIFSIAAYPNPFNNTTTIEYNIPYSTDVNISIFDIYGTKIMQPINQYLEKGEHSNTVNMSHISKGIYYCKLKSGNQTKTIKLVLSN